ncbi:MAG: hypothetical protein JNK90_22080 [Planctomycetaceae bacterium]|nr:hypothetical protein [Planctomycetaceae bacterium]
MTFQEPNVLKNDSSVDLSLLHPYFFCDINGQNASDTAYLPVQPTFPLHNAKCSSLWRGFIATMHLRHDGVLQLQRFDFPYSPQLGSQIVDEPFKGDFSIIFRPFFPGPSTIVPFRAGMIVRDSSEWVIDDQTMTASVSGVYGNSGLNVWVCGFPGFIPCSLLPKCYRERMRELIGTEITCKLIKVDELRRNFIFCPLEFDGDV